MSLGSKTHIFLGQNCTNVVCNNHQNVGTCIMFLSRRSTFQPSFQTFKELSCYQQFIFYVQQSQNLGGMENHKKPEAKGGEHSITKYKKAISQGLVCIDAAFGHRAHKKIGKLIRCISLKKKVPKTACHRVVAPRLVIIEVDETSHMLDDPVMIHLEESQLETVPLEIPMDSLDDEEMEIDLADEDLIEKGTLYLYDPD